MERSTRLFSLEGRKAPPVAFDFQSMVSDVNEVMNPDSMPQIGQRPFGNDRHGAMLSQDEPLEFAANHYGQLGLGRTARGGNQGSLVVEYQKPFRGMFKAGG